MTEPRFQHSFNLDEKTENRLKKLVEKGIKIIDIINSGIDVKEKELMSRKT